MKGAGIPPSSLFNVTSKVFKKKKKKIKGKEKSAF